MGPGFYCLSMILLGSRIGYCDEMREQLIEEIANEENQ